MHVFKLEFVNYQRDSVVTSSSKLEVIIPVRNLSSKNSTEFIHSLLPSQPPNYEAYFPNEQQTNKQTTNKQTLTISFRHLLISTTAWATASLSPATAISFFIIEVGGTLIRAPVLSVMALSPEPLGPMMKGWYSLSISRRSKASLACL